MKAVFEFQTYDQYQGYLRTYFAAMAMQGLLSNSHYIKSLEDMAKRGSLDDQNRLLVRESIDMADELIKNLE